jgi:hypothetical protein
MGLVSGETGRGTLSGRRRCRPVKALPSRWWRRDDDLNFNYPSLPGQADLLRNALRQLALSGDLEALLRYQRGVCMSGPRWRGTSLSAGSTCRTGHDRQRRPAWR